MSDILVTKNSIEIGQIALTTAARFLDFFRFQQTFTLLYTGPNYRKEKFLWWTTLEEGEKLTITVCGKPHFCEAVISHIQSRGLRLSDGRRLAAMPFKTED